MDFRSCYRVLKMLAVVTTASCVQMLSAQTVLTQTEAQLRSQQISNVDYSIDLDLTNVEYNPSEDQKAIPTLPLYSGRIVIQFKADSDAQNLAKEFFLDFTGQDGSELKHVVLNGAPIQPRWEQSNGKIYFPTSALKLNATNQIQIDFVNRFTRNGKGFHRALDKEDNEIYVFTNLEPFYANEVFPLFDQPDLKAHFQLVTEVPSHWTVVSNTREITTEDLGLQKTKWTFERSERFSTYLFAFVAGPYHIWTPKVEGSVPLRLLARKSLAPYINGDDFLQITQESFDFYEKNFGKYPFHKYDQIIVPEITSGAMENVGAVTFNESYIPRGSMTTSQKTRLASTLAHEMAHMWFGDLVTMKWWDDLWLNESFASFMSPLVLAEKEQSLALAESWSDFFSKEKLWGYEQDGYATTHPIVVTVSDTQTAKSIFDGISYGKGSATLKQLYFYVGQEKFFEGLRIYFNRHRFQNTTRADFLAALSEASGLDLKSWDEEWLGTKGTNAVQVSLTERDGKITKLVLQPFPDPIENKFRTHRTQVGLYDFDANGQIVLRELIPVTYAQDLVEISEAAGKPTPVFVFGNAGDFDFTHEILDSRNLNQIRTNLDKIADPLLKQQLYAVLFRMVENAQISGQEYVDIVIRATLMETDATLLTQVFGSLGSTFSYVRPSQRLALNNQISEFLFNAIRTNPEDAARNVIFGSILGFANSENDIKQLANWLQNGLQISGVQWNQDRRWDLISALARNNYPGIEKIIQDEAAKDQSNRGILLAQKAQVRIPTRANKEAWFADFATPKKFTMSDARSIMGVLHNVLNESLTQFVEDRYLDAVLNLARAGESVDKVNVFANLLYPLTPSENFSLRAAQFVESYRNELAPMVIRTILNHNEDAAKMRIAQSI